jgi:soluble lytic murein transglycosylase
MASSRSAALARAAGLLGLAALFAAPSRADEAARPIHEAVVHFDETGGALGPLASPLDPHSAAVARILSRAGDAYRAGRTADGDRIMAETADPFARMLGEWIAIRLTGAEIGLKRIEALLAHHPDAPTPGWIAARAEEALLREKAHPAIVLRHFARSEPATSSGILALARAHAATGEQDRALRLVRPLWRGSRLSAGFERAVLKDFGASLTRDDHAARLRMQLARGDRAGALRAAQLAGPEHAKLTQGFLAAGAGRRGNIAALDKLPAALAGDPLVALARARALRRADRPQEAAKVLAAVAVADEADLGDAFWEERRLVARELIDADEAKAAYALAAAHRAQGDEERLEAEFHAGWIALRFLKDPARAGAHFAALRGIASTPISQARAFYWSARAADARGESRDARRFHAEAARHPTTFYGQLSAAALGEAPVLRRAHAQSSFAREAPPARAIRLLAAAGESRLVTAIAVDLATSIEDAGPMQAVADLLSGLGQARAQLVAAKLALRRGLPVDLAAFPVDGVPRILLEDPAIDRAKVLAIARQESAFQEDAVSHAGARGLMQLMPATARETAQRHDLPYAPQRLTSDPAYNTRLGAAHLKDLMAHWRGSRLLVVAAYNAGSGNVRRWIAANGDPRDPSVDPIDWIERIPYSETRNYVQRVLENLQVYRIRLAAPAPAVAQEIGLAAARPCPVTLASTDPTLAPARGGC